MDIKANEKSQGHIWKNVTEVCLSLLVTFINSKIAICALYQHMQNTVSKATLIHYEILNKICGS